MRAVAAPLDENDAIRKKAFGKFGAENVQSRNESEGSKLLRGLVPGHTEFVRNVRQVECLQYALLELTIGAGRPPCQSNLISFAH